MKLITTNQEVLLFTGSRFSNREFSRLDKPNNKLEANSFRDELERACWAGLLFEMLPELAIDSFARFKMYIWNIHSAEHFLLINQGTDPHPVDATLSIDPHFFLPVAHFNN